MGRLEDIIKYAKAENIPIMQKDGIEFLTNYIKENNIKNIQINVYGNGAYLNEFLELIYDNELEDYIRYCGETSNPKAEMNKYDAVVDFTLNHSFGMPYIEAILNGKMLYCTDNIASHEVLNGIDGCIYSSYEDLVDKIRRFPEITEEQQDLFELLLLEMKTI